MHWIPIVAGGALAVVHYLAYRLWLRDWIGNRPTLLWIARVWLTLNLAVSLCFPFVRSKTDLPEWLYVALAFPIGIGFVLALSLAVVAVLYTLLSTYLYFLQWKTKRAQAPKEAPKPKASAKPKDSSAPQAAAKEASEAANPEKSENPEKPEKPAADSKAADSKPKADKPKKPAPKAASANVESALQARRASFARLAALGGGIFFAGYSSAAVATAMLRPKIVRFPLPIGLGLCVPWRIVQLSDLHIGGIINYDYVQWVVQETNALKPDIIVLTGDILDAPLPKIANCLNELGKLNARLGKFFVLGNHEYFYNVEDSLQALRNIGIRPLLNESVRLGATLQIVGVGDLFGRVHGVYAPDLDAAYSNARRDLPTILLMHQPKFVAEVQSSNRRADLVLCGHTHGGQMAPFSLVVMAQQGGYLSGLYRINEHTRMYVSSGTGYWGPPMRFGTRTEITMIEVC